MKCAIVLVFATIILGCIAQETLTAATDQVVSQISNATETASNAAGGVLGYMTTPLSLIYNAAATVAGGIGSGVSTAASTVGSAATTVGSTIGGAASTVAGGVAGAASSVWGAISGVFGSSSVPAVSS